MARIAVEFTVTVELEVPDELAAHMALDDVAQTADFAARYTGGSCPLVVTNDVVGTCTFSMRPLCEGLTPADIALGVFYEPQFPLLDSARAEPDTGVRPMDRPFVVVAPVS